jgi:hypothetical protein
LGQGILRRLALEVIKLLVCSHNILLDELLHLFLCDGDRVPLNRWREWVEHFLLVLTIRYHGFDAEGLLQLQVLCSLLFGLADPLHFESQAI